LAAFGFLFIPCLWKMLNLPSLLQLSLGLR
jgi:hypothetical protein